MPRPQAEPDRRQDQSHRQWHYISSQLLQRHIHEHDVRQYHLKRRIGQKRHLLGGSTGNLIEENSIGGNTNGLLIQANASGNLIRLNVIAGNPPSQFSKDYGAIGWDVKDEATSNAERNTFDRNWCISYAGPHLRQLLISGD